jgi:hypothetical protein
MDLKNVKDMCRSNFYEKQLFDKIPIATLTHIKKYVQSKPRTEKSLKFLSFIKMYKRDITPTVSCISVKHLRPKYNCQKEWTNDPKNVYIGRLSPAFCIIGGKKVRWPSHSIWHNPYTLSQDKVSHKYIVKGPKKFMREYNNAEDSRRDAIRLYKQYLENNPDLVSKLVNLTGKNLGCWCKPQPCHGDILVNMWSKYIL